MGLSTQYLEKIEKQLREFGDKIDELNAKIKSEAKTKYNETTRSLNEQMNEAYMKLNDNIDSHLKEWGTKIEELTDKAKQDAKAEYEEVIKKIRPKVDEFKGVLNELKKSSDEAIIDIKTGATNAWNEMKNALDSAISKFK